MEVGTNTRNIQSNYKKNWKVVFPSTIKTEAQKPWWPGGIAIQKFLRVREVFARNHCNCTGMFPDHLENSLESFRVVSLQQAFIAIIKKFEHTL